MCAAYTALVFAVAVQPLAAQTTQSATGTAPARETVVGPAAAGTPPAAAAGMPAAPDESKIPLGNPIAGPGAGAAPAPAATPGVSTWDFVRMILILACVIGVIYLLFWVLRKGTGRRIQENDLIHVLGSRGLSGNRSLHLVEVGTSVYLVGSSDGGVALIAEISEKESLDAVRLKAAEQAPGGRRTFQQTLSEIFRPAKRPFTIGEGIGFLKGQRERLKKL
ncbi:MAG: FliO/MopB family protein [Spirochaetia bacterium]